MINLRLQDRALYAAHQYKARITAPSATHAAGAISRPKVLGEVHVLFAGVESYNVISHHFIFK